MRLTILSHSIAALLAMSIGSSQASACSIRFNITNLSGHTIHNVIIDGPGKSSARQRKLVHGASFKHHSNNWHCHGYHYLSSHWPEGSSDVTYYLAALLPQHHYGKNAKVQVNITNKCKLVHKRRPTIYECASTWTPSKS